jgi:hypothetical protein
MRVVDATSLALESIKDIHRASGFDYQFPKDFSTPLFPLKRAVVDGGKAIACAALKVEAEAYLWMDHAQGTPEERLQALELLNSDLAEKARVIGFDQVHCALPPEIAERFGARLETLGWKLARPWPIYVFQLR